MKEGATRDGYGSALEEFGSNPKVVVLDAGVSDSTRTKKFGAKFPERFFNVGISEGDMVCTAAGLASTGKVAFATSFACFLLGRTMGHDLTCREFVYARERGAFIDAVRRRAAITFVRARYES